MYEPIVIEAIKSAVDHTIVTMDVVGKLAEELSRFSLQSFGADTSVESLKALLYDATNQNDYIDFITQVNAHLAMRGVSVTEINILLQRNNDLFINSPIVESLKQHVIADKQVLNDTMMVLLYLLRVYLVDLVNAVSARAMQEKLKGKQ